MSKPVITKRLNQFDEVGFNNQARIVGMRRVELKTFLTEAMTEAYEAGLNKVASLGREEGKLFSEVVAKAFEAPFPEVAVQHAMQRIHERAQRETAREIVGEVKALQVSSDRHCEAHVACSKCSMLVHADVEDRIIELIESKYLQSGNKPTDTTAA
jgi:hypothetical protein